jgi:hypothetical protein
MVHSEPVFGRRLLARTADRPEGPWSDPVAFYEAPGMEGQERRFPYAGKAHLECSRPGELLVSYAVNSHDFADVVREAAVYRPYFVRVPLDALAPRR